MTLEEFKALLLTCDADISKYEGPGSGNYTVWTPGNVADGLISDDEPEEEVQRVYVERFTKSDNDAVAAAIKAKLISSFIPFEYEFIYEKETKYRHHSFTCYIG